MQASLTPPKAAGPGLEHLDLSRIAQDLQIRKLQVESAVQLLDEGNTVPFITRYRKERTGGLDEEVIRIIQARVQSQRQLNDRKTTILKTIETQGKLTDELRDALLAADTPKRLEDLYLPYKPKKRSLATTARERGLEPLALAVWNRDPAVANLEEILSTLINPEKELNTVEDVLTGVQHILAEVIAETADVRAAVRHVLWENARIGTTKSEKLNENQGREYKSYFNFTEAVKQIPPHRVLAINRGEKENALVLKLDFDPDAVKRAALSQLPLEGHPQVAFIEFVAADALSRLLLPSLEREIRKELTMRAEGHAVRVFARNLRSLLLAPPLRGRRILAIDPGFRSGCKLAALDETGNLLEQTVIFPHPPQNRRADAKAKLEQMVRRHQTSVIAIGNGTACRETEEVVSDLIAELEGRRNGVPSAENAVASSSAPATSSEVPNTENAVLSTQNAVLSTENAVPSTENPVPSTENAGLGTENSVLSTENAVPSPPADAAPPPAEAAAPAPPPPPPPEPLPEAPADLAYVIVNEAGASVYSASPVGREEFPDFDATTRGTISIGRRLQDPLSELVKIDPQNVGVGLYQHDVNPKQLKESLEAIIESCVNQVGVDLNTASIPLLRHVSGLNQLVARDLVEYRKQNGPFKNREQLRDVPNVGPVRWVQAAGFLKIDKAEDPLDTTWIHPESYPIARQLLADLGYAPEALTDRAKIDELRQKLSSVSPEEVAQRLQAGVPTVQDIMDALARPGRDPRDELPPPIFKKGILRLEDLQPGMELKGTVLNVVDFGAFVDIGIKDTGLVHISQMANRYVKSPYDVTAVGDVVNVWVISVDPQEHKVSLSMIKPGSERRPQERGAPPPRQERREPPQQGHGEGQRQDQGQGQGHGRGGPPRGRRPAGGPPGQRRGGPPPQRREGGPPPQEAGAGEGGRHHQGGRGGPPRRRGGPLPAAPPPTRKPARPVAKPKLSQAQLKGEANLRTFSELAAFLEAQKKKPDEPAKIEPAPAPVPPPEEAPPAPPAEGA